MIEFMYGRTTLLPALLLALMLYMFVSDPEVGHVFESWLCLFLLFTHHRFGLGIIQLNSWVVFSVLLSLFF